jgi:hypothetical protein
MPLKPFIIFDVMVRPTLPLLSEAPIIAIDFGERKTDSGMLMNLDQIIFHNKGFIKFGHHECIIENI